MRAAIPRASSTSCVRSRAIATRWRSRRWARSPHVSREKGQLCMHSNPFESLAACEESDAPAAADPSSVSDASESGGALLPAVAREPIADGSQVLLHDGFDVEVWVEALGSFPKLRRVVAEARGRLVTADALIRDLFWSFHRRTVSTEPLVPLTPAYAANRQAVEQLLSTLEGRQGRDSVPPGNLLPSPIATIPP